MKTLFHRARGAILHGAAGAMLLGATALTGVVAQTAPAAAQAARTLCKIDLNSRQKGWIAPEILFLRDGARVMVVDGIVLMNNDEQPVEAKIADERADRVTYTWEVRSKDIGGRIVRMKYRATRFKQDGAVSVSALPLGYANSFTARGRCDAIQ
ncbi:hypothetical protein [Citreimonas sp.]|uniref:hypothetical protein n=1 Tax=Citreimonas sp. TaxID=3036715 RepID=UPI004059CBB4